MAYILDTDHLGILQRRAAPEHSALLHRLQQHPPDSFHVTIITFHEQVNGWNAYINRTSETGRIVRGYGMFQEILRQFALMNLLPFDLAAAQNFAELRTSGTRIGTMDLRIASIALA